MIVEVIRSGDHSNTASHSPAARPPAGAVQFGLAYGDTLFGKSTAQIRTELADVSDTGASWARVDLAWIDIQPQSAAGYDWTPFDTIVRVARQLHVHLLVTVGYTPAWARPSGCSVSGCAPADPKTFAAFARAAAARYDGIAAWEIWNEPNTPGFWAPHPDADAFSTLVTDAAAAIRSQRPDATVVSGGLAATTSANGAIDTRAFLRQMCRDGVNKVVDAIGYHPYTYPYLASYQASFGTAWNKIAATPQSFESVLRDAGTAQLPIWATEYGAPTGGPGALSDGTSPIPAGTDHVTDGLQASIASDSVTAALGTRGIGALFWYSDRDEPGTSNVDHYGLRDVNGQKKPSYSGWQRAVRRASADASLAPTPTK
ncbi:MAG TPA: cellulase family glycosylhydrolase [Jatrophihabitantaceae bacterium]